MRVLLLMLVMFLTSCGLNDLDLYDRSRHSYRGCCCDVLEGTGSEHYRWICPDAPYLRGVCLPTGRKSCDKGYSHRHKHRH